MQQEMQNQPRPSFEYEGDQTQNPFPEHTYGQKLLTPGSASHTPTSGQRLALAIVSLSLFIFLVFTMVIFATLANVPAWAVVPILFIFILFSVVAIIINVLFNRSA